jgi:hypothetical protein
MKKKQIMIQLDNDVYKELEKYVQKEHRTVNNYIEFLVFKNLAERRNHENKND